ncbi:HD domain-containing protein [Egicoccus sp. AB-alg2]|uniref:HD domain-containing protein n=1 Tax=Egicoccus sp. AB-alg2 TaxID=3242693 RepID=UPI00359F129D
MTDDRLAEDRDHLDPAAAERDDAPPPPEAAEVERPQQLGDPAVAIAGSAEAALVRGIDAQDAVAEAAEVALETERRTGGSVDILTQLQSDEVVSAFIKLSDQFLDAQGFTEHGFRHANLVGRIAHNVLLHLGADRELCDLAAVGGYLHDVGNVVSRMNHGLSGAWIAYDALRRLEVDPYRIGLVLSAIGNHEEQYGSSIGPVGAAVILADKADVHRSRVRKGADTAADIHDRVNDAVTHSFLRVDADAATITLELELDTTRSTVIEYFEIFLERMVMCRRAARTLGCEFRITANGVPLG